MMVIISLLCLIVGVTSGWFFSEKYWEFMSVEKHEFDELFEKNPHPELFDNDGSLNRGEYMAINFDLGYDPEEFDPEDITGD